MPRVILHCRCAQRLTASMRGSPSVRTVDYIDFKCSTPNGINARITGAARPIARDCPVVLNA